ncbi:MAG: 4'-phosphopantetheinyl transferase family protein [Moraxellaceae bacterium]
MRATLLWLRDDGSVVSEALASRLSAGEQAELAAFPRADRRRGFLLSRRLLRRALTAHTGEPDAHFTLSRAASGRLQLDHPALHASLSHGPGRVAALVADAPCGVDIEGPRRVDAGRIARRYFAATEIAYLDRLPTHARQDGFLRLWTLKEAAVKALHQGLAGNMRRLVFDVRTQPPQVLSGATLQCWQQAADAQWLAAVVADAGAVTWTVQEVPLAALAATNA